MSEYRSRSGDGNNTQPRPQRSASNTDHPERQVRAAGYERPAQRPARPASAASYERPAQRSARPASAAGYERPAQRPARPASAASQERPAQRPARPTGTYESRYGKSRDKNRRADERRYTEKKAGTFASMPEWLRLAMIAVVFMGLIAGAVKIITNVGSQPERTVIRPMSASTETPQPNDPTGAADPQSTSVPADPSAGDGQSALTVTEQPAQSTAVPVFSGGERQVTIRMAGDVIIDKEMLDSTYNKGSDSYSFEPYFEYIGDTLSRSDYTMINIDASLHKGKYGYSGYPQFTTPPVILNVLKSVGVDMITMCNNHMLDAYCSGLVDSVERVDAAGLDHIGGYVDEEDSRTPEIYDIGGIRVGFVTYTHSTNTMENYCDERTEYLVNYFKKSNFEEDIRKAREAGAEFIVAVTHWGTEYVRKPDNDQVYWAKKLVAAGADLIIGGHPHVVQAAEYITASDSSGNSRTALCVYSIGNFLSQHRKTYTDSGIVFEFTLRDDGMGHVTMVNPGYVPVYVWTFKNAAGNDDYRVLPMGTSLVNPPASMSQDQYQHMNECWNETLALMQDGAALTVLDQ